MSGPGNYREAERLAAFASTEEASDPEGARLTAALALAHATLALAAATALPTVAQYMGDDDQITAWGRVIGWADPEAITGDTLIAHIADAIAPTYINTPSGHPLLWNDAERIAAELTRRGLTVVEHRVPDTAPAPRPAPRTASFASGKPRRFADGID